MKAPLRPDQNEAVTQLYEHDRAIVLGSVGSGKTLTVLQAMYEMTRDGHVKHWLVVAPKRVCVAVWPVEIKKWWFPFSVAVAVAPGKKTMPKKKRDALLLARAQVTVVNYDVLQSLPDGMQFDAVVFDELTKLKNSATATRDRKSVSKGKRFAAIFDRLDTVSIRWGMTGSFTSNGLSDVFGQCKIIDETCLGRSKGAYLQKFFIPVNPKFGQWTPRPGALDKVMQAVKPLTVFLDNETYRKGLPCEEPAFIPITCAMDMKEYKAMQRNLLLELEGKKITAVNSGVATQKLEQLASGFVYHTEQDAAEIPGQFKVTKTPVWRSYHKYEALDEIIEENQRAPHLIVYWYPVEMRYLKQRYPQAVHIDEPNAIDRWNKGNIELLLVHPASAGHGLNLQFGGHFIVYLTLPRSLELFEQVWGRLLRTGQRHAVKAYLLLTEKTVDEKKWRALRDKKDYSTLSLDALKT